MRKVVTVSVEDEVVRERVGCARGISNFEGPNFWQSR